MTPTNPTPSELPCCTTCNRGKAPIGRDVPIHCALDYCGEHCEGYRLPPLPGRLWPEETR